MAVIEEALATHLKADVGLAVLVVGRVYPFSVPQNAGFPAVTYQRISTPRVATMDMAGATGTLANMRFQIDSWADNPLTTILIANAVRAALNGKTGILGAGAQQVVVRAILADNEVSEDNPEVGLYRMICDYVIWMEE